MKFQLKSSKLTVLMIASLVLSAGLVGAQTRNSAPVKKSNILRVKTFSGLASKNVVKTPEYKTNINRGRAPAKLWYRLAVSYDTAPDWIDELTFQYYAMSLIKIDGAKVYTIFKTSVRYADIEVGNKHLSVAYLHPKAVERYGDVVAVAFEVVSKGAVIAEGSDVRSVPEKWWKDPAVTESESVTVKDGYLLSKAESPFVFVNIDDYEFAK